MYSFQAADHPPPSTPGSGIPFAQINIKPQSRQKTLKLNPPALPLGSSFTTLQAYQPEPTPKLISESLLVILSELGFVIFTV